jgi:hypothetical protein
MIIDKKKLRLVIRKEILSEVVALDYEQKFQKADLGVCKIDIPPIFRDMFLDYYEPDIGILKSKLAKKTNLLPGLPDVNMPSWDEIMAMGEGAYDFFKASDLNDYKAKVYAGFEGGKKLVGQGMEKGIEYAEEKGQDFQIKQLQFFHHAFSDKNLKIISGYMSKIGSAAGAPAIYCLLLQKSLDLFETMYQPYIDEKNEEFRRLKRGGGQNPKDTGTFDMKLYKTLAYHLHDDKNNSFIEEVYKAMPVSNIFISTILRGLKLNLSRSSDNGFTSNLILFYMMPRTILFYLLCKILETGFAEKIPGVPDPAQLIYPFLPGSSRNENYTTILFHPFFASVLQLDMQSLVNNTPIENFHLHLGANSTELFITQFEKNIKNICSIRFGIDEVLKLIGDNPASGVIKKLIGRMGINTSVSTIKYKPKSYKAVDANGNNSPPNYKSIIEYLTITIHNMGDNEKSQFMNVDIPNAYAEYYVQLLSHCIDFWTGIFEKEGGGNQQSEFISKISNVQSTVRASIK